MAMKNILLMRLLNNDAEAAIDHLTYCYKRSITPQKLFHENILSA